MEVKYGFIPNSQDKVAGRVRTPISYYYKGGVPQLVLVTLYTRSINPYVFPTHLTLLPNLSKTSTRNSDPTCPPQPASAVLTHSDPSTSQPSSSLATKGPNSVYARRATTPATPAASPPHVRNERQPRLESANYASATEQHYGGAGQEESTGKEGGIRSASMGTGVRFLLIFWPCHFA
jgi:hypothetical protein